MKGRLSVSKQTAVLLSKLPPHPWQDPCMSVPLGGFLPLLLFALTCPLFKWSWESLQLALLTHRLRKTRPLTPRARSPGNRRSDRGGGRGEEITRIAESTIECAHQLGNLGLIWKFVQNKIWHFSFDKEMHLSVLMLWETTSVQVIIWR